MNDLAVSDLINLLADASNRETDQFNEMLEHIDALHISSANYSKAADQWEKNCRDEAKKYSKALKQSEEVARASVGIKKKWDDAQLQLKEMKALNPKKQREQIKRLQESNRKLQTANAVFKKDNKELAISCKEYRSRSAMSAMTKVWLEDPHYLTLWPNPIAVQFTHKTEIARDQVCLLYIHDTGAAAMIHLSDDHEAVFGPLAEHIKPTQSCIDVASQWLRRVNITQKGKVTEYDLLGVK